MYAIRSYYEKGFDNSLIAYGMSAKTLSSTLADPMNPWTIALNEVAASTGIPATILVGQQTGRLASDEDGKQMAKVVMARRQNVLNPMIKALFDRLVKVVITSYSIHYTKLYDLDIQEDF